MNPSKLAGVRDSTYHLVFGASKPSSKIFDSFLLSLILISVVAVTWESSLDSNSDWAIRLRTLDLVITIIFSIEYLVRLWCHPRPLRYVRGLYGTIDFVSIFPTYLALFVPGWEALAVLRVLRVLRIFRVFTLGRYSRAAKVIAEALSASRFKIGVFIVGVLTMALITGSMQFLIEGPDNGFTSIPIGILWALSTLTTLGSAELIPSTPGGQVVAAVTMLLGYAFIAIPIGIVTSEVLATKRTREDLLSDESTQREFKSSAFHSYQDPGIKQEVLFEASVLKPVAGFLNAKGGRLVIGVSDEGKILGIEVDLELKKWSRDKYVNTITNKIGSALGMQAAAMTNITLEEYKEGTVCLVDVLASSDPVYLRSPNKLHTFFVRVNNSTRELTGPDLVSYIGKRWD